MIVDVIRKTWISDIGKPAIRAFAKKSRVLCTSILYLALLWLYTACILIPFAIYSQLFYGTCPAKQEGNGKRVPSKNVLITTAKMSKSLHLIRCIKWKYPHFKLYCTDSNFVYASKYSNCIEKGFTVAYADSNNRQVMNEWLTQMIKIIIDYKIDLIIPGCSIEEAKCLSILKAELQRQQLDKQCTILIENESMIKKLDDKDKFFNLFNTTKIVDGHKVDEFTSQQMEIYYDQNESNKVIFPFSIRFQNKQTLETFIKNSNLLINKSDNSAPKWILKRIVLSNNRDEHIIKLPTNKRELLNNIVVSREEPWILQEFIEGDDVSACVYTQNGEIKVYVDSICCDCCVNYYPVNNGNIKHWLVQKCKEHKLTGIMCFDFMVRKSDGRAYVLECNPRPHSCILMMNNYEWVTNIFEDDDDSIYDASINPKTHIFWLFHELLRLCGILNMFPTQYKVKTIMNGLYKDNKGWIFFDEFGFLNFNIHNYLVGQDAILNIYDPFPVVVSHGYHMPLLIIKQIMDGCKGWSVFDLCIVKLVGNKF